jgi:hypothetical protein
MSEGKPYDKLLELVNMDIEQQNGWALRNMTSGKIIDQLASRYLTPPDPMAQAELDLKRERLGLDREKLGVEKGKLGLERDKLKAEPKINPKLFDQEQKLRKEINDITKDYRSINNAYGRIRASVQDPSAAGDLALIFNYMKMLDPGSVVRESEFATAQNAGGVDSRVRAVWNKLKEGERLSQKQRNDFFDRSNRLYTESTRNYQKRVEDYEGIANRAGIDPKNVITHQTLYSEDDMTVQSAKEEEESNVEATRVIGDKTYIKMNGQWYEK